MWSYKREIIKQGRRSAKVERKMDVSKVVKEKWRLGQRRSCNLLGGHGRSACSHRVQVDMKIREGA